MRGRYGLRSRKLLDRGWSRHAGFTLLELILALAIGSALIMTVYVAARIHLRMADRGPVETGYSQRVAAVLQLIEDDVKHIIAPPPGLEEQIGAVLSDSFQGGANGDQLDSGGEGASGSDDSTTSAGVPYGLWGAEDTLVLYRTLLPSDLDLADALASQGMLLPRPAVYRVTYFIEPVTYQDGATGYALWRGVVPAGFETLADELPLDPAAYPHYRRLLDHVTFVQFSYTDGYEWLTEWGGDTEPGPPPLAVEVVLGVQPPAEIGRVDDQLSPLAQRYGIPAGSDVFRKVITVPVADAELLDALSTAGAGF